MARKKKTEKKADPEKAGVVDSGESTSGDGDSGESRSGGATSKGTRSGSKRKPKKKRARKKAAAKKKASTAKKAATGGKANAKKKEAAGGANAKTKEAAAKAPPEAADPEAADPEDEIPVEDLDAALEDDGPEDLDTLIAATVAVAAPEEPASEPPADPLDDASAVEILDIEEAGSRPPLQAEAEDAAAEAKLAGDVARPPGARDEAAATEPPPSTEEDLAGTIDLGEAVSSPELRDRLLAQTLAHAEMQDARYRVPFTDPRRSGRWKAAVAIVLFLVAVVAAVAPPAWVRPDPPATIDTAARARGIRRALLLQAQQVNAYRVRWQRLPDALDELPGRLPGVRFVRSGNRAFQLIAYPPDGDAIVYDSTDPAPEFERLAPGWTEEALP